MDGMDEKTVEFAVEKVISKRGRGPQFLLSFACIVVIVAGLKAAESLVVPLLIAVFITLLCIPPARRLQKLGLSPVLSTTLVMIGVVVLLVVLSGVLAGSISDMTDNLDLYKARLDALKTEGLILLGKMNIDVEKLRAGDILDTESIMGFVSGAASELLGVLSHMLIIVFLLIFMLLEASDLPAKLRRAHGNPDADLSEYAVVTGQLYEYLHLKTMISLITGVAAGGLCALAGVEFPVLWGLVAFLFNFVPNVGSILAAIPPVLLALLMGGVGNATVVAIGYAVINVVIGNFIEPKVFGRHLGLSAAVVVFSLFFWNWVLGPVGMLLSLPLTMVVKILLEHSGDYRFAAVLLGPAHEPEDEQAAT